jgi:hypothetical protein
MKVVINSCFGGFSLSPLAVQELAKRKGRACYLFTHRNPETRELDLNRLWPCAVGEIENDLMFSAFDTPNPPNSPSGEAWHSMSMEEKMASNFNYETHSIPGRDIARDDKDLIAVVGLLGERASGRCAALKIVEIPDGTEWEIEEYDGNEHIAERHATWR